MTGINDLNFIGTDASNHSVVLSAGDPKVGASPAQLLLIAVSACSGVDVVEILKKKRTPVEMLEIIATVVVTLVYGFIPQSLIEFARDAVPQLIAAG